MNLRPGAAPSFPRQPIPSLPYLLGGCSRQLLHALLYLPTSLWVADAALPPPSIESCIHAVVSHWERVARRAG